MSTVAPVPAPTALSAPFWAAARRHELVLQHCLSCGRHIYYPRHICPSCGSAELDWVPTSGRGTVYTFTVARRSPHPGFAHRVPYVVATVELEEGPRLTTNIVGCDVEAVRIGMAVQAAFDDVDDAAALVVFRPVEP